MMRRTFRVLPLILVPWFVASCADKEAPATASVADEKRDDDARQKASAPSSPEPAGLLDTADPAATSSPGDRYRSGIVPRASEEADAEPTPSPLPEEPASGAKGGDGQGYVAPEKAPPPAQLGRGTYADKDKRTRKDEATKEKPQLSEGGQLADADVPRNMYFQHYGVNPTIDTDEEARSTFAVDVDTASFTMARSYLERGNLPNEAAVRVEEIVNAFDYGYSPPTDGQVFNVHAEAAPSPNRAGYHVLHVGIKGKAVPKTERKNANLVFVIDVSGSMDQDNRLGLVKKSLGLLVSQLDEADKVGIVTYGSTAKEVLQPTSAFNKAKILTVIDGLRTEGATNAEAGLRLGYQMAAANLREGGINRVVLCSDGVANVGLTGPTGILSTVEKQVQKGITLTAIGVGMGNYNDVLMEQLADKGNGNYYYVDKLEEARRVFVDKLSGTLETIAKDVKIQVDFDKMAVARYRLIGYENRGLAAHQFDNDSVDAGEVGAGHAVTAIYEVKLKPGTASLGTIRIRYKQPTGSVSQLIEQPVTRSIVRASTDALSSPSQLSLVAAQFGEKLRGSYWARNLTYEDLLGRFNRIQAPLRQRADVVELRNLIQKAEKLDTRGDKFLASAGPIAQMGFDRVPVLR